MQAFADKSLVQWGTDFVLWYAVFLFSATLHEASHSYASAWGGDDTAYRAGSATLNPLPHMEREKVGMILMPILSFFFYGGDWMLGWASAPFNPYWAARYPRRSFVMSLAGPLAHLIPLSLSWLVMGIGLSRGWFLPFPFSGGMVAASQSVPLYWALAKFLNVLFMLNLILLILNLIPVPPFDGSEIWYLFVKSEETRLRWRYNASVYGILGIAVGCVWIFPKIYPHAYLFSMRMLYRAFL